MDAQSGIRESEHRVPTFRRDDIVYDAKKDFIGEGEFGEVFKAKLGVEEKRVAVKVLRTPQRLTQAQISSLMKEATILQQIGNHPNIVRLLGVCIHPQHYAVVLHYSKCNLDRLIVEKKSEFPRVYEWPCRLQMAHGIACGMNYLHELTPPVIHRDLKSSNVLVSDENGFYRCRISDFGFAKMRGISSQTTRKSLRSFGSTCSTLPFIAPERFQGDAEISRKVDVYGYAIILWQLEEMKRPYAGETAQLTVRENVLAGVRPYLSKDNAPPPFQNLIIQCWAALPEKRPTFREIVDHLDPLLESSPHGKDEPDGQRYSQRGIPLTSPSPQESSLLHFPPSGRFPQSQSTFHPAYVAGSGYPTSSSSIPPSMPLPLSSHHPPPYGYPQQPNYSMQPPPPAAGQLVFTESHQRHGSSYSSGVVADAVPVGGFERTALPDHHLKIQAQWKILTDSLDPVPLVDELYSKCPQMTPDDMDMITCPSTRLDRAKKLLSFVQQHGPDMYEVFLKALHERQSFLYDALMRPLPDRFVHPSLRVASPPGTESMASSGISSFTSGVGGGELPFHHQYPPPFPSREACLSKLGPDEHMNESKSQKIFDSIAPLLGNDWMRLARSLKLTEPEIENIRADHRGNQREQGYQVLLMWSRSPLSTRTRSELCQALLATVPNYFKFL
eukprot:m.41537 g.41537  ORF g.41537 m.41537 type:complete len:670 (+) comp33201_c0_seq3:1425-3434(+)